MKFRCNLVAVSLAFFGISIIAGICPGVTYAEDEVVYRPNDDVLFTMTDSQARVLIGSMDTVTFPPTSPNYTEVQCNYQVNPDSVTWEWRTESTGHDNYTYAPDLFRVNVSSIGEVFVISGYQGGGYRVCVCPSDKSCGQPGDNSCSGAAVPYVFLYDKNKAVSVANAFYVLKGYAEGYKPGDETALLADFQTKAKAWRALAVKPALSEDVEKCRVMAEDALRNKNFEKAVQYYEKGLAIEPLWPQGQFNAALLEGELHAYRMAAFHMKRYLLLVPDAPNARAAQERIWLWEEKAKEEQGK